MEIIIDVYCWFFCENLPLGQWVLEYTYYIPWREVIVPIKKVCPKYDAKLYLMVRLEIWSTMDYAVMISLQ